MKLHFRENLIYLRKKQGYTQNTLANELGISRSVIGAYEEGRSMPPAESLIKISDHFGITIDDILKKQIMNEDIEPTDVSLENRIIRLEKWITQFVKLNK